ncbi:MAG: hypothetical protein QXK88_10860 [Desulfurococcaceae archaeon]
MEEVGISHVTLWRLLGRESPVKPKYIAPLLRLLTPSEFEILASAGSRLRSLDILKDGGAVDYSLILEIMNMVGGNEYLKNAILRFVVQEFKEDTRKVLEINFAGIKLEWSEDFENFLLERKKCRKARDPEAISYYRSLFKKHLEGRELSEELVEYVANHKNGWLRKVFRHYVQYLYHRRRVSPETFGWIMEVVPQGGTN